MAKRGAARTAKVRRVEGATNPAACVSSAAAVTTLARRGAICASSNSLRIVSRCFCALRTPALRDRTASLAALLCVWALPKCDPHLTSGAVGALANTSFRSRVGLVGPKTARRVQIAVAARAPSTSPPKRSKARRSAPRADESPKRGAPAQRSRNTRPTLTARGTSSPASTSNPNSAASRASCPS